MPVLREATAPKTKATPVAIRIASTTESHGDQPRFRPRLPPFATMLPSAIPATP